MLRAAAVVSSSLWPYDGSLPGSSVLGILLARVLDWVAISFSRGSFWPRDQTLVSCIQMDSLPLSHQGGPPCLQATFISKAPRKTLAPLGFQPVTYPAAPMSVWLGVRDIFYVTLITSSSVSLFLACFKFHLPSWQKGERKPIRFPSCEHCRIWQKPRRTKLESSLPGTSSPEPSAQVSLQNIYSWW